MKHITLSLLFLLATAACPAAEVGDPTHPSATLTDSLRTHIGESNTLKIQALVVGASEAGVALLGATPEQAVVVRRGSHLRLAVDSLPVELEVVSVTTKGVELAQSSGGAPLLLPGSHSALPTPERPEPEFLRHLECEQVPLGRLLRLVADQTGVNIASTDATAAKRVSIFLRNIAAETAVEEICRATGLWFRRESKGNVIRISTLAEYAENLDSFREETTETFTLLYPNVIEVASVIYGLYPDRTLLSLGEEDIQEDDEYDLSLRFRRFRVMEENGNSQFMQMQAPRSSSTSGRSGSGNFSFSRGNAFSNLSQWDQLRNRQAHGHVFNGTNPLTANAARQIDDFARTDTNAFNTAVGETTGKPANIFVSMSKKNNLLVVRTSDVRVMEEVRRLVKKLDVPTPMVLLELKLLEIDVTDDFAAGFNWKLTDLVTTSSSDTYSRDENGNATTTHDATQGRIDGLVTHGLGKLPGGISTRETVNAKGITTDQAITRTFSQTANIAASMSQGAATIANPTFAFSILSERIAASIELMQKDGKVTVLSTPTLLTANNEVSRIFSGKEYPIVTGWTKSETTVTDGVVVTTPATAEIEQKDVGTMLLITPNINADKTVTLRLLQENSAIAAEKVEIPVDGASGMTKAIDYVESRSLTGTFVAKDNSTIMAGGLIRESDEVTAWRTPYLGSLPLVGWLFRGTEKAKRRTELVVLIRPHVIMTPFEGGKVSEELMKALSAHPARDGRANIGIFSEPGQRHTIRDDLNNLLDNEDSKRTQTQKGTNDK